MQPPGSYSGADARHLGVLVGQSNPDRIIAVSTSTVFEDKSLAKTFWGIDNTAIDSGFQGHMYTRPNDILVVCVPDNDAIVLQMVLKAVRVNYEIWRSLMGIDLASSTSRLVLASGQPSPPAGHLPETITWHMGSLADAAIARHRTTGEALLAFVLDSRLADKLEFHRPGYTALMDQARTTSLLMDKNSAMQVLQDNGVNCAATYPINAEADLDRVLRRLPASQRYVFKPAGGAAGIGVFSNKGRGAPLDLIRNHLDTLTRNNQLPARFQIQEFIPGAPFGVTACFDKDGTFEIFEIHQQLIDDTEGFVGARWTPANQAEQMESTYELYRQLAAIKQPRFQGLICLDVIDGRVIEINPRLTAAAPIAHILRQQEQLTRQFGSGFRIGQIDLNTDVPVPYESIGNGTLRRLIDLIWKERSVLVLPQGLNPFGDSRLLFINDDTDGNAQQLFLREITREPFGSGLPLGTISRNRTVR